MRTASGSEDEAGRAQPRRPEDGGSGEVAQSEPAHVRGGTDLSQLRSWTFITSHAHVLLAIAQDPELRVGEIAEIAGITERSAYRILSDLVKTGYLRRTRVGRRNRYELDGALALGDPVVEAWTVSDLLAVIGAREDETRPVTNVSFHAGSGRAVTP